MARSSGNQEDGQEKKVTPRKPRAKKVVEPVEDVKAEVTKPVRKPRAKKADVLKAEVSTDKVEATKPVRKPRAKKVVEPVADKVEATKPVAKKPATKKSVTKKPVAKKVADTVAEEVAKPVRKPRAKKAVEPIVEETKMGEILRESLDDIMGERFGRYSKYIIQDRALPDARDGLKPVQRRILFSMNEEGNRSDKAYRKSAKSVGAIMGNYHPHGDCLGGDTLIRLADGTEHTIKSLYERNEDVEIFAVDKENNIVVATAHSFRIGQHADTVYRIELSNGETIRVTGNHPILMASEFNKFGHDWAKAEELEVGDVLYSGFGRVNNGYSQIVSKYSANVTRLSNIHTLIAGQLFGDYKATSDLVVHHVDEDKLNNTTNNLVLMTREAHAKLHGDYETGLRSGNLTMATDLKEKMKLKNSTLLKNYNKNQGILKAFSVIELIEEDGLEVTEDNYNLYRTKLYNAPLIDRMIIRETVESFSDLVSKYARKEDFMIKFDTSVYAENGFFDDEKPELNINRNLTDVWATRRAVKKDVSIVSIEVENVDNEPMYDFTVDDHENMLLFFGNESFDSFIVVHNSSIYEAMTRMSQDWKMRQQLIDMHGNNGSIDGDSAAAMRYCVTGDTLVLTDRGLVRMDEIVADSELNSDTDISITVESLEGTNTASKFFNSGEHKTIKISLNGGYGIEGSLNHPVLVKKTDDVNDFDFKWVLLEDIQVGDKVVLKRSYEGMKSLEDYATPLIDLFRSLDVSYTLFEDEKSAELVVSGFDHVDTLKKIQIMLLPLGIDSIVDEESLHLRVTEALSIKRMRSRVVAFDGDGIFGLDIGNDTSHLLFKDVVSVEESDEEKVVYSIKVDSECHSFVANGIVNHNTEARLSKTAELILRDIEKDTVDFVFNFDDTAQEPTVLPATYPNLLVNGATGISAGYATDIPPHNAGEVIDGVLMLIDKPKSTSKDLMEFVKGPDFPGGGIMQGIEGIQRAYETGKGSVELRSRVEIETAKNGKVSLVITEIPYEVIKAALVTEIDRIRLDKEVDGIIDVRDETGREGMRIVVELRKDADHDTILKYLYKKTKLQVRYNFNMVAIYNRAPKQMTLRDFLTAFLDHRVEVIKRRSVFELAKAKKRQHIVEGLVKAVGIMDDVIKIIKGSKSKADSKEKLVSTFDFSELQAEAIVTLQLYRLSTTDINELKKEEKELAKLIKTLEGILASKAKLMALLKKELLEVRELLADERRTEIQADVEEINIDMASLIVEEDVALCVTRDGYVKRSGMRSFNSSGGFDGVGLKDSDEAVLLTETKTTNTVVAFTNRGNYVFFPIHTIDDTKWKDVGRHISTYAQLEAGEFIVSAFDIEKFDENVFVTIIKDNGLMKRTPITEYVVQRYTKPYAGIKNKGDESVVGVWLTTGGGRVVITTEQGYGIHFGEDEVAPKGVKADGMRGIDLREGDRIVFADVVKFKKDVTALEDTIGTVSEYPRGRKGNKVKPPRKRAKK